MGADGNVDTIPASFRCCCASILIEVVNFGVAVFAFGEINFGAEGQQSSGIEIGSDLIPHCECCRSGSFCVYDHLQSIAIKKPASRLDFEVQRTNRGSRFSQKDAIVKLLADPERQIQRDWGFRRWRWPGCRVG